MSIVGATYTQKLSILPKCCGETGERIPWFTTAYFRQTAHDQFGVVHQEDDWISNDGYLFLKLKGNV